MKATPTHPGYTASDLRNTPFPGEKIKRDNPVNAVELALGDVEGLTKRIHSLVEKLVGPHPISGRKPSDSDMPGTVFGNLANRARDAQAEIAEAHEALDFIEGQIS